MWASVIAIGISAASFFFSFIVWIRQRKYRELNYRLNLMELQLKEKAIKKSSSAKLRAKQYIDDGIKDLTGPQPSFYLQITNMGLCEASNIRIKSSNTQILVHKYSRILEPNEVIEVSLDVPKPHINKTEITLIWDDDNGVDNEWSEEFTFTPKLGMLDVL